MAAAAVVANAAARGGRQNASTTSLLDEVDQEVLNWTPREVKNWLEDEGFGRVGEMFLKHQITGAMLFDLRPMDYGLLGIKRVGVRLAIQNQIASLRASKLRMGAKDLKVPMWPQALFQFFSFAWAQTSEGKTGLESKEELCSANLATSLVSALLTAVSYQWFMNVAADCFCRVYDDVTLATTDECYCSPGGGYDLTGAPLRAFFFFSGISALLFLLATVICILQIVGINEMSDEAEMDEFFELLEVHETVAARMVSTGLLCMMGAAFSYVWGTDQLGVAGEGGGTAKALFFTMLIVLLFVWGCISAMIRNVYRAKIAAYIKQEEADKNKEVERERVKKRNTKLTNNVDL